MRRGEMLTRRLFLGTAAAGATIGAGAYTLPLSAPIPDLRIQAARYALEDAPVEGLVSLSPDAPPPALRLRQGVLFEADVTNTLRDFTAM
ncbi:MAG: multicopper oxidase family protein, partial [Pseudomonadota bacterium]